jgi:hypothetical protein
MENKGVNFGKGHGMNGKEVRKEICNVDVVCGKEIFKPKSVLLRET